LPFAGLDDDLDHQSVCVSVTLCLGEIPLANTPTQTAHTLSLTATGVSEDTGFEGEAMAAGWILALSPLHSSHYN